MNFQVTASNFKSEINKLAEKFFHNRGFSYLLIFAVVAILYHSSLQYNFISDDYGLIERAKNGFNFYNIFVVKFLQRHFYRPITCDVFYSISYNLFKLNPLGYRIVCLALFILNNCLVYEIARRLTKRRGLAIITSIFYVSRGAHSQAIYWIAAGYQESGMAFFVLCSIFLYLQFLHHGNKLFYVSSLICSIFALLSKEASVILPLLILIIEIYVQEFNTAFNLKTLIRRVAPFFMVTLLYFARVYIIGKMAAGGFGGFYKMEFSLYVLLKNIAYYITLSVNTQVEIFMVCILVFLALLKGENRKYAIFSILWFFIGLLPFVFLEKHGRPYYLSVSLVGFSFLLSIGIKYICDRIYSMRYVLGLILLFICIICARINIANDQYIKNIDVYEKFTSNFLSDLKHSFPSFPDGSLIYIKDSNYGICWLLCYGAVIKLNYENNISVYFEGLSKKLPVKYSHIYYFNYDPDKATINFEHVQY